MRQLRAFALAAALAALCAAGAQAQTQDQPFNDSTVDKSVAVKQAGEIRKGDPARWHSEDTSRQSRLRILQKEIGAAYEEAKNACRETAASGRKACLKDARASYERDMKNAPAQLDNAPKGTVETTVQTVQGPAPTPTPAPAPNTVPNTQ